MKIPLCRPDLDQRELAAVRDVLESGWLVQGPRVATLEQTVCDLTGSRFAVACSSGSTALHLALLACGIGAGDEVIVPSFTWVATAAAIEQAGATPVFVDIDSNTYNIDWRSLEPVISESTRAIMPVSLFGLPVEMTGIAELARRHDLVIIEDAACSLGATREGRACGTDGNLGCYSFHPRKSVTCGEGGMVVGQDPRYEERLRSLRNHGIVKRSAEKCAQLWDLPDVDRLGYNYRLSDIQAAIALAQLDKLDSIIARRREIAAMYNSGLHDLDMLTLPAAADEVKHIYQSYVLRVVPENSSARAARETSARRNAIMAELQRAGVETRPGTMAVHRLSYFRRRYSLQEYDFPESFAAERQTIALPIYPQMRDSEIVYVIETLRKVCKHAVSMNCGESDDTERYSTYVT